MAKGKDTRNHPNRRVNKDSFTVHIADLEEPEIMNSSRLIEYGQNVADANKGDSVPHKVVKSTKQAIANTIWAGDEVE